MNRRDPTRGLMGALIVLGFLALPSAPAAPINVTHGANSVTLEMVTIGYLGNPGYPQVTTPPTAPTEGNPGLGGVSYEYMIGKYEISVNQWNESGVTSNGQTWAGDQPASNMRAFEAAQFCNWLMSGDKNLGAYTIDGFFVTAIDREGAIATYGRAFVLPTPDEWYKAAYYNPSDSSYATQAVGLYGKFTQPVYTAGSTTAGEAVMNGQAAPADIDNAGGLSFLGTMGQGGNVAELMERIVVQDQPMYFFGSDYSGNYVNARSIYGPATFSSQYTAQSTVGLRVVMVTPEPTTMALLSIGGLALLKRRRGRGLAMVARRER